MKSGHFSRMALIVALGLAVVVSRNAVAENGPGNSDGLLVKVCHGTSEIGSVEVKISNSPTDQKPSENSLQGYFKADVLVNGAVVYTTDFAVYNSTNDEYFTSGSSEFMLTGEVNSSEARVFLQAVRTNGALAAPSFNTIAVTCK